MLFRAFLAVALVVGKVGPGFVVEKTCYRRIITGKRLHERFIRHSLPCNSLQACQHQCSIEKHFTCEGFNIRLDPARIGRGVCELSSVVTAHLDFSRDFVFDLEFAYYERDHDNGLPNCGYLGPVPNGVPAHNPDENAIGYQPPPVTNGGPYYGGDSYGPWSTGHGTIDHGPWGSHGYGSGFYESNNPSRGQTSPSYPLPKGPYSGWGPGPSGGSGPSTAGHNFNGGGFFHQGGPFPVYGHGYGYGHGGGFQTPQFNGGSPPVSPTPSFQPNSPGTPTYGYGYGYGYDYVSGGGSQTHHFSGGSPPISSGPPYQTNSPGRPTYGYGYGYGYVGGGKNSPAGPSYNYGRPYPDRPKTPDGRPAWGQGSQGDRRYDRPNRIPTYIIIDADARGGHGGGTPYRPRPRPRPSSGYLPVGPPALPRQPPLIPPPQRPPPPYPFVPSGVSKNPTGREVCFRREHPGYKLNSNTIRGTYETPTVLDCEAMCTNSPFKCTGYSFRYSLSGGGPNCLLTDYTSLNPETHLLPDRSCDVYLKMSSCMDFDRSPETECFVKVATNRKLNPSKLVKMLSARGMSQCELACLNSQFFTCRSFSFRHGPPIIGEPVENCFLSDWPVSAMTHLDFVPLSNHEVYERGSFGHGCELDMDSNQLAPVPYPNIPQIPHTEERWAARETWRHFTVNGWPCRAGTECELNSEAGFWACEVEGGDRAQWDYCCRPRHSCGFSRGYNYPWCYVGEAGPDQWRPCSEFYYPDFGNRFPNKPVHGHNPHPHDSYGPPRDTRPWNFGSEEFGPPSYWPISYVYAEPPPNESLWDPEEQHHYFHYHDEQQYELQPPDRKHEHSELIRFKPCGNRHPYPRAIVQKLDLKNVPRAGNPEEQSKKDEKHKKPKLVSDQELGFSPENRDKKNSQDFFPSATPTPGNVMVENSNSNSSEVPLNKTKEVIKQVDKIIMESSKPEKNESLTQTETKYPSFFRVSLLENPEFWD